MENLNLIYQVVLNVSTLVLLVTGIAAYFISPSDFKTVMQDFKSKEIVGTMLAISLWSLLYMPAATTAFTVVSLAIMYGLDYFSKTRMTARSTR